MKYPKTIKFRVLQRDINKAVKVRNNSDSYDICRDCILAQAAKRILKPKFPTIISVGTLQIRVIENKILTTTVSSYDLAEPLKEYIALFPAKWKEAKPSKTYVLTKEA